MLTKTPLIVGLSFLFSIGCATAESLPADSGAGATSAGGQSTGTVSSKGGGTSVGGAAAVRGGASSVGASTGGGASTARGGSTGITVTTRAPSCTDLIKNGDESDVDCGGTCPVACAFGKKCAADTDCADGVPCATGLCTTCTNSVLDGNETDVDCGGSCPKCAEGKTCKVTADCSTYNCEAATGACGVAKSCVAVIRPECDCSLNVVNAGDAVGCQKVLDCYLANECGPTDTCAATNDSVCGGNKLGVDLGKLNAAKAVYACNCK